MYYLGGGDLLVARVLHVGHGVEVVASGEAGVAHAGLQVHCGHRHDHVDQVLRRHHR